MALFTVMLGLLALSSAALGKKEEQPACYALKKHGPGENPCNQPLDICLILDSSGSIGAKNYRNILRVIAKKFLPKFNINQKQVRVQFSIYSTQRRPRNPPLHRVIFRLNKFNSLKPMQDAVLKAPFFGAGTPTGYAMAEARKVFVKQMRKNVKKIKIVLTDGVASDTGRVFNEGVAWSKIAMLKCLGVGIGPGIKLRQTCGAPKNNRVFPGGANNIKTVPVKNIKGCERQCEMTAFCKGFSFHKGNKNCVLKRNGNGNGLPNNNFISRKCSPGVSEITQGKLKYVFHVKRFNDFGKFVEEKLIKETCGAPVVPPKYFCPKCRAKAFMYWVANPETFLPVCDKDNSYAAKQCNKKFCWCVTKEGERIKGTQRPKGRPLNCKNIRDKRVKVDTECRRKAAKVDKYFNPSCDAEGNFKPVQCVKGPKKNKFCWCSTANGKVIPSTLHKQNSPKKPNCLRHRNLKYDCKDNMGNFPHPWSKRRFISCVPGNAFACVCPGRTVFNKHKGLCAYTTKKPKKN